MGMIAKLSCPITMKGKLDVRKPMVAKLFKPTINTEIYQGEYKVVPKPNESQILKTANKTMIDDVTVTEIPYYKVSNNNGHTVYIGKEIILNGDQ